MNIAAQTMVLEVPSTTANLGPGFDCLGLALDAGSRVEVTVSSEIKGLRVAEISGEGADELPTDEGHLFFSSWKQLFEGGFGPDLSRELADAGYGVEIRCHNRTPLARGLGSSAALRVASSEVYRRISGLVEREAWQLASILEGHPDNAAPAGLGGLVASLAGDGNVDFRALSLEIHPCWEVVCVVPSFSLSTDDARRVLPASYSREEVVYNLSSLPFLVEGLRHGNTEWVGVGCRDRVHQRQRASLIPGFDTVCAEGVKAGAAAVYLSGAGPTIGAFVDRRESDSKLIAQSMTEAFAKADVEAQGAVRRVDLNGLTVERG